MMAHWGWKFQTCRELGTGSSEVQKMLIFWSARGSVTLAERDENIFQTWSATQSIRGNFAKWPKDRLRMKTVAKVRMVTPEPLMPSPLAVVR